MKSIERQWAHDWPDDPVPEHEDPPFDRDRFLPQSPFGRKDWFKAWRTGLLAKPSSLRNFGLWLSDDHRAGAFVGEDFGKQRIAFVAADDVRAVNAARSRR
jgi:hypothetical protein